jgi:hypothetical protein
MRWELGLKKLLILLKATQSKLLSGCYVVGKDAAMMVEIVNQ